jgi:hypothetical protein
VAYVSIPGSGTVEAYDFADCSGEPLWVADAGMGAKRMWATEIADLEY